MEQTEEDMSGKKESNGTGSATEALKNSVRMLKIRWLQARNGDYMVIITFISIIVVGALSIQFMLSLGDVIEQPEVNTVVEEAEIPLGRCKGTSFGLGEGTPQERASLKREKISVVKIPFYSKKMEGKLEDTLAQVETQMNAGWNKTGARVLPLGDYDYVRRDLTVYKAGFEALGYTVLKRAKSGVLASDLLRSTKAYDMLLCLSFNTDHCFHPDEWAVIGRTRKVNRIKNLRDVLWSKDKFCRTMNSATRGIMDKNTVSFTFPCWVMPGEYKEMLEYSKENNINQWISKPKALGGGKGIEVVNNLAELAHYRRTGNLMQAYLEDPHLIKREQPDGSIAKFKWDMRSYVLVTSVTPLRAYIYERGLIRIATSPYQKECKNKTSCLTNTSINKKVEGAQLKDITWSFYKLKKYLQGQEDEEDYNEVFLRIQKAIGLALISAESKFLMHYSKFADKFKCDNCYHLLGVDVIFDAGLEPKVVEINGEPSLKLTVNGRSHYDITKKNMGKDLLTVVYSQESGVTSTPLVKRLMDWAECLPDDNGRKAQKASAFLGKDHLEYVIDTFREHQHKNGFKPIYPNPRLADAYARYLKQLHEKEGKLSPTYQTGEKRVTAHADGRRYRLHKIITALQNKESLVANENGDVD